MNNAVKLSIYLQYPKKDGDVHISTDLDFIDRHYLFYFSSSFATSNPARKMAPSPWISLYGAGRS